MDDAIVKKEYNKSKEMNRTLLEKKSYAVGAFRQIESTAGNCKIFIKKYAKKY